MLPEDGIELNRHWDKLPGCTRRDFTGVESETVQVHPRICCKRSKAGVLLIGNHFESTSLGWKLVQERIPLLPKAIFATDMPFRIICALSF